MAAARPQPIPVFAEMSSINPVIVLPQALETRAESVARDLTASVVQGCGQFCTNPGLVIGIRSPQFTAFTQQVAALIGDQAPQTMLNAGTLQSYGKGLQKLLAHPGIEHLAGNARASRATRPSRMLFKLADASLLINGSDGEALQEEVFGPTTVFVEVADQAQLGAALHGLHGQLDGNDDRRAEADFERFNELTPLLEQKVGRILLNGYPTGVEVWIRWCTAGSTRRRCPMPVVRRWAPLRSIVSCVRCASRTILTACCPSLAEERQPAGDPGRLGGWRAGARGALTVAVRPLHSS